VDIRIDWITIEKSGVDIGWTRHMNRHDNAITTREFWDAHAAAAALSADEPPVLADLFRRYLPASPRPGRRALEIGA
jgi:hypothetical protein